MTEGVTGTGRTPLLPLVVDLDGTLIATDLLQETATDFAFRHPFQLLALVGWWRAGRQVLKRQLADWTEFDPALLPYDMELVLWLREERERGRTLVLASASDGQLVEAVARHLGVFDEWLGSTPEVNLRSAAKRDALVARFGEKGFEYVGNSTQDLPVWEAAATAHVVTSSAELLAQAGQAAPVGRTFPGPSGGVKALVKALRVHQWVKNVLVLAPLVLAHRLDDGHAVLSALLAFAAFCVTASSVYVLNDLSDVANDRAHRSKRNRPFAAGRLSLATGWAVAPLLAVAGIVLGLLVSWDFLAVLLCYLVLTLAYTFVLKRRPIFDVIALAGLYTLRLAAGTVAVDSEFSAWLLSFSIFLFLGLALIKRVSELFLVRRSLGEEAKGRGYRESDLELLTGMGVASSCAAVLIFALYVDDPATRLLYESPGILWLSVPILLVWLMRMWLIAHRGEMHDDPIVFSLKDRTSVAAGALLALVFAAASVIS